MTLHQISSRASSPSSDQTNEKQTNANRASLDAFLSIGFRPFFLLAALFAALSVTTWNFVLRGVVHVPSRLGAIGWHAHEMIFGVVAAVLAGFLLTAVQNWTKRVTATGAALGLLALLWIAGRVLTTVSAELPMGVAEVVDVLFLPAVAVVIGIPIVRSQNRRNYGVPVLLLVLAMANVGIHLSMTGVFPTLYRPALAVAVMIPHVFLVLIGGRVIPMFTTNGLRGAVVLRDRNLFDLLAIVAVLCALVAEGLAAFFPDTLALGAVVDVVTGVLVLARMVGWKSWATRKVPLVWVLHVGYAFLGIGFLSLGLSKFAPTVLPQSTALHVLTIGALGVLMLGMMSRVALGHSGRPLVVKTSVTIAFAMLGLAVIPRVVIPLVQPSFAAPAFDLAALLWTVAFGIFAIVYVPILTTPRADA